MKAPLIEVSPHEFSSEINLLLQSAGRPGRVSGNFVKNGW